MNGIDSPGAGAGAASAGPSATAPPGRGTAGAADTAGGSPGTEGLTVRPWRPADLPRTLELLTASLAGGPTGERSAAFFAWKHLRNPFGESPGLVAEAPDGRLAGVRLFLRWEYAAAGRTVRAVRPVDTATHPDFRGRGVFRRLTLGLLEEVAGDTELVLNTPNASSLPGYLSMGWREAGRVPVAVRPVRAAAFARGVRAAVARRASPAPPRDAGSRCPLPAAAEWFGAAPDDGAGPLAELLRERAAADAADPRLATVRTPAFLRWRYGGAPGLDYRVLADVRGGELAGVAFGRPRRRGPLTEFTLADVVVRPGDRAAAARLLRAAAGAGCDHVATHLAPGTEAAAAALRCGYLTAPRTGMTLVSRAPGGGPGRSGGRQDAAPGGALADWRFTLGDLEVF
ncbi:GNAT family N-acetyltransferase [Streptacidiphilus sp. ASG 303]|uniref:GNAT family N-acetyltransferase n=1 Tax=Streptacidiphilus sp. ASG 303 TaxID=2896847 RepID=UPI001E2EB75D|nr:GNAT family N-acetyltransferase [Streptacidiphilus sp. ASG 303]MCD0483756.1 GNAT family N-acetyltransferase [Streptacidiphilus sp. ASG 303]